MNPMLFSELIVKLKIKPDFILAQKIDDIEIPYRHIKCIKKDINNLFLNIFLEFLDEFNKEKDNFKNIEIINDSSISTLIEADGLYELKLKKIKKVCPDLLTKQNIVFDDRILTNDFMDEIDRIHIIMSMIMGLAFRRAIKQIDSTNETLPLQAKFIYDEILDFWTKFYKSDFCYLTDLDLQPALSIEEKEIELCIVKFFFNLYKKTLIDLNKYKGDQLKIISTLVNDKSNYKWYVIFGFWLVKKLEDKNIDFIEISLLDYKSLEKTIDQIIN